MITKVTIEHFKKFKTAEVELNTGAKGQPVLFVGQNNGGKTTALQAIALWSFFAQQWREKKGKGTAQKRTGAPIPRNAIAPAPVRNARMLWRFGEVQGKASEKIVVRITVHGISAENIKWSYGVDMKYANEELIYCNPTDHTQTLPEEADKVFHLPPLSGVQTSEQRLDPGAQLRAIGEGRPGEVLRNLLLNLFESSQEQWGELTRHVHDIFGAELLPISYNSAVDPDIVVWYRPLGAAGQRRTDQLEIASAGSGFLQFLLIAAFLYSHQNSVLLIDEPDSHMHVFLQRGMYDWLRSIAAKQGSQLIISTHSEVLVNSTDMESITAFFGESPHKLQLNKGNILAALKVVSPLSISNAEWKKRMLFAEGDTDLRTLKAWAETLKHRVSEQLKDVFFRPLKGQDLGEAFEYFKALQSIIDGHLNAFCIRDGDAPRTQNLPQNFDVVYWERTEIENYLIHSEALLRFLEKNGYGGLFLRQARDYLERHIPKAALENPLAETIDGKGSVFLDRFFDHLKMPMRKGEYWQIAQSMKIDEIPTEVSTVLDKIYNFLSS